MTLFEVTECTDSTPAEHQEDSFKFLNRVHSPYWEKVRNELNSWFARYPPADSSDLAARFRSSDPTQHFAAFWELHLFNLFGQIGYEVDVHPEVDGATHPDFRATREATRFYVEALTVFSGIVEEGRNAAREAWVLDLINAVDNGDFSVGLEFVCVGKERPSAREVQRPIESWLASLDADTVRAKVEVGEEPPELEFAFATGS